LGSKIEVKLADSRSGSRGRGCRTPCLPSLNDYRLSELSVRVRAVLDCRDPVPLGVRFDDLVHDTDYEATQAIGAAAFADGLEGLLVHSATRLGDNLILFPDNLRPGSRIEVVSSRDPRLYAH
jgi:hypothetical protein